MMQVGKYVLQNDEKVERALNGTVGSQGQLVGGVGSDAEDSEILAEYDRLGGLILFEGKYKVKTGSFWDFKGKTAVAKPNPMLTFNVNGETVEVPANKPLPLEVQAANMAAEKRAKKLAAKVAAEKAKSGKKGKKGKKKVDEEDEEEESEEVEEEDADEEGDLA